MARVRSGTSQARHDGALHPRRRQRDRRRDEPARPARARCKTARPRPKRSRRRARRGPAGWRWRTSSADHGPAWRAANAGHVSLGQLKVMSAIERCRTAALGGHVERCEDCAPHGASPTTPAATGTARSARARRRRSGWPTREAELLPVPLFPRRLHAAGPDRRHRLPEQGASSMTCCSRPRPRPCSRSRPIPSISAPASASPPCSTPGARQ